MSELKDAWEIAREKANKLGKLSPQEMQQQREQEYRQVGKGIAQRYLDNPEPLNLPIELDSRPTEGRGFTVRTITGYLAQAMDLESHSRLEKIIQGIAAIEPRLQPVIEQIRELAQEHEQTLRMTRQAIENKGREALHQLRISGTAVRAINTEAVPEWQQNWRKLTEPFLPKLDNLKRELTKASSMAPSPSRGGDVDMCL
ncbi:MAG: hypothetical protein KAW83_00215 [Dehalococcoidia bacterium]|nr:hypothetical protein [Dehalococcoidia bacterium]